MKVISFFSICFSSHVLCGQIKIVQIAKNLMAPVAMDSPKDGTNRLFICEQTGKIKIIKNQATLPGDFLDIGKKLDDVNKIYSEKGLLGIAFHPKYKTNGRFFIFYTGREPNSDYDNKCVVAEYKVSSNPNLADLRSERIVLEVAHPESNHNGGQIAFGPDGYLYIGLGDGGGAGDQHGTTGNGQDLKTMLGKILRINVDAGMPYEVPKDNPFVNYKNAQPEIWAYGLRNPWRFSFDRKTGKLFCGDVGQNKYEEIDIIEKGKNYGWRIMEGDHCYQPEKNCNQKGLELPIAEYDHSMGVSVTGGFVYRGKKMPLMTGRYIFADWKGNMYFLEEISGTWKLNKISVEGKKNNDLDFTVNSFGEDENGELYILGQKKIGTLLSTGAVYLIEAK